MLEIKEKSACRWDLVSLGEVLLRFDPGDDRVHTARNFRVWEGGGEYNVARNLAKCFGLETAIVTSLADNQIGRLVADLVSQGCVDTSTILWRETDGISRSSRNGMYFMERGFGSRPPTGCSDRGNTAVSQLKRGDVDWDNVFVQHGTRWFHTGGIFAALSETTAEVAADAMSAAKNAGSIVSYDLNYRDSLWSGRGGRDAANVLNGRLLEHADVVFGAENFDAGFSGRSEAAFRRAAGEMIARHPSIRVVATTLRDVHSASRHSISAMCFADEQIAKASDHENVDVLDRVGSGDAFAAGLIYGILNGSTMPDAVETGIAAAVLSLASLGDGLSAQREEVERLAKRSGAAPVR
ncbi:MAG TPA: sugar kinase [Pyrinomonadaceae bacterium]|nr:sugar kinase [Pyrinomonadaceae bacterium]